MTLAAAIDIGSNSVHLLLAEMGRDGCPVTRLDENLQLGLGGIVDRQGRLGAAARRDTLDALAAYTQRAREAGARRVLLLGTQPLRRAADRSLLRREVHDRLGLDLVVLTHDQEAALTLLGVTLGSDLPDRLVVMDVGGGSTEVILVGADTDPVVGAFPVGSARLSASLVHHDPPVTSEIDELTRIAVGLAATMPTGSPARGIVSGGSGTNVSRLLGRPRTAPLDRSILASALELLCSRPAQELSAASELTERRVRQLAAGICLVQALMDRYGLAATDASDAGLREGALIAAARDGDDWLASLGASRMPGAPGVARSGPARSAPGGA